jgi:plastocyanin
MRPTSISRVFRSNLVLVASFLGVTLTSPAQGPVDVTVRMATADHATAPHGHSPPLPAAAVWLTPVSPLADPAEKVHSYTLLQKNKMFTPHLLVVPIGSVVHFPNADPFFHNVFSLFDGRRFDLGLYEAGTSRDVTFSREGISYIFCNIHPEMSAVVIVVRTTYFGTADLQGRIRITGTPADTYTLHVWVEGEDQAALDKLTRRVQISAAHNDLGTITLPQTPRPVSAHENKFGEKYDTRASPAY